MSNKQKVSLQEFYRAKHSVAGRLSRLKKIPDGFWGRTSSPSPIAEIGVFDDEIEQMERTLKSMQKRLDNAKITVKL